MNMLLLFIGLSYTVCERKMQLLTLVSLAVESREVPFSALTGELQLDMCEVEQLIIDGTCECMPLRGKMCF